MSEEEAKEILAEEAVFVSDTSSGEPLICYRGDEAGAARMTKLLNAMVLSGGVVGSILVAANAGLAVYGYSLFLVSSTASVALLRKAPGQLGLLWLNVFYIGVNVFGLLRASL